MVNRAERYLATARGPLRSYAPLIVTVAALTVSGVLLAVLLREPSYSANALVATLSLSLLTGAAAGMAAAFAWDRYARRLTRAAAIGAATGLPVVASIPALGPQYDPGRIMTSPGRPASAYRALVARIVRPQHDSSARCLLVTSATRRDGRTTVAANLAAAAAADGLRVVLVGADARSEHRIDQFHAEPPTSLAIAGHAGTDSLESALQPTRTERLRLLTAHDILRRDDIGHGIDDLARLLDRLTKTVDLVVIDAPPVLEGPEAGLLAQESDHVLLVVDVRHARRSEAALAISQVGHVHGKLIGCVANDSGRRWHPIAEATQRTAAAAAGVRRVARSARHSVGRAPVLRTQWWRRHRSGVLTTAVVVGLLASSLGWFGGEEPSAAGRDPSSRAAAAEPVDSAAERSLDDCRSARDAQTEPLAAAAVSLRQLRVHVRAMNRLVAGEITLDQAKAFWERTRVRAARKLRRFAAAYSTYDTNGMSCEPPAQGADEDLDAVSACQDAIAARDETLEAARAATSTWHHHLMDMNMLRAGDLSPERAVRRWQRAWKTGAAELHVYRTQRRQARHQSC